MRSQHLRGLTRAGWLTSFLPGERRFVEVEDHEHAMAEMKLYHTRICELKPLTFSVETVVAVHSNGALSKPVIGLLCVTRTDGGPVNDN